MKNPIFGSAILAAIALLSVGCGEKEKQYKDDPARAAEIQARKEREKEAANQPPPEYPATEITEVPDGHFLYTCYSGRVSSTWSVSVGGEPKRHMAFGSPKYSPDGKRVLYAYFGDKTNKFELGYKMASGGELFDIASNDQHDSVMGSWSPDGTQIVYVQKVKNPGDIAIINVDGTGARVIAAHPDMDESPSWSPDGKTIAFNSYRDGESGIYTVPVAGGKPTRITDEDENCQSPVYSPDGKYMAMVVTYRHAETRKWVRDLRVVKLDDMSQRTLSKGNKMVAGVCWSPGSQWLVFGRDDGTHSDLILVDINGEKIAKVTDDEAKDSNPTWRP